MSEALRCDGPDCESLGDHPFLGWWTLESSSLAAEGEEERLDFCSWACLGAFVFDKAADVETLAERITRADG